MTVRVAGGAMASTMLVHGAGSRAGGRGRKRRGGWKVDSSSGRKEKGLVPEIERRRVVSSAAMAVLL